MYGTFATIVENSFHTVWNSPIDKRDLGLFWRGMKKDIIHPGYTYSKELK
jgi:hypothetical protein